MGFFKELINSFSTSPGGLSGRKLSAAASLIWACYLADKLEDEERMYAVLFFLVFSAVCLGLVTIPELIKFLSSRGSYVKESTTTIKEEKTAEPEV